MPSLNISLPLDLLLDARQFTKDHHEKYHASMSGLIATALTFYLDISDDARNIGADGLSTLAGPAAPAPAAPATYTPPDWAPDRTAEEQVEIDKARAFNIAAREREEREAREQ